MTTQDRARTFSARTIGGIFLAVCAFNFLAWLGAVAFAFSNEADPLLKVIGPICMFFVYPIAALFNAWNFRYDDQCAFVVISAIETLFVMWVISAVRRHPNRS